MSNKIQAVRGTQSLYGPDADRLHRVISAFNEVRQLYRFRRVEVPVFEHTQVFARSIGETTDIVSKQMYTFEDQSGDSITLRPEFTAGICRAYISEGWQQYGTMKLATYGPVFRYERPQKGRYRQFHQLDAEIIGADSPAADVELLAFAAQVLRRLDVSDAVTLELNTLGDATTRDAWRSALVAHFERHRSDLSEESLGRLSRNPLRILDSKEPQDRSIIDTAPGIDPFLTNDAAAFFTEVTGGLDEVGVAWTRNSRLVRGLDYYRHTAFEFVTDLLGAQGAVIAGGRYDGLIESLGGTPTPSVGWAAGIERLAMLVGDRRGEREIMAVVPENEHAESLAQKIAFELRNAGVTVDYLYRGGARKRLERYQRRGLATAIFVAAPANPTEIVGTLNIKRYRSMSHSSEARIARNLSKLFDVIGAYEVEEEGLLEGRPVDLILRRKKSS